MYQLSAWILKAISLPDAGEESPPNYLILLHFKQFRLAAASPDMHSIVGVCSLIPVC